MGGHTHSLLKPCTDAHPQRLRRNEADLRVRALQGDPLHASEVQPLSRSAGEGQESLATHCVTSARLAGCGTLRTAGGHVAHVRPLPTTVDRVRRLTTPTAALIRLERAPNST